MIENRQFKGYITTKTTQSSPEPVYDEFIPFKPTSSQKTLEYDTVPPHQLLYLTY